MHLYCIYIVYIPSIIKIPLSAAVCLSEFGRVAVPKELCDAPITDDTSITVLLPNTDDKGICSYAMLEILMKIQNEFLDEYLNINEK